MKWIFFILPILFSCVQEDTAEALTDDQAAAIEAANLTGFQVTEITGDNQGGDVSHYLHRVGETVETCSITTSNLRTGSSGDNDITCYLDVEELDLHFLGTTMKLGVPEGACDFVVVQPYWFWRWQPGSTSKTDAAGATTAEQAICSSCSGGGCADDAACFFSGDGDTPPNRAITAEVNNGCVQGYGQSTTRNLEVDQCVFDYSEVSNGDENGPNCDIGSYTYRQTTHTDTTASGVCDTTATVSITKECSGSYGNCTEGPGVSFGDTTTSNGLPTTRLYALFEDSLLEEFEFESPFSKGFGSNRYLANFTKACGNYTAAGGTAYNPSITGGMSDYSTDIDATPHSGAYAEDPFKLSNPFYTFLCLDRAREIKGRIRILVRDWNVDFPGGDDMIRYVSGSASNDATGTADTNSMDDRTTEAGNFGNQNLNDYGDWDDNMAAINTEKTINQGDAAAGSPYGLNGCTTSTSMSVSDDDTAGDLTNRQNLYAFPGFSL